MGLQFLSLPPSAPGFPRVREAAFELVSLAGHCPEAAMRAMRSSSNLLIALVNCMRLMRIGKDGVQGVEIARTSQKVS